MSKYIIATIKSWNIDNCYKIIDNYPEHDFMIISDKDNLSYSIVKDFNPDYLFFPHWSWIIPKEIYNNFRCVVFHMTDLPFGRGGSPLQNLIVRGIYSTKISAIRVDDGLDTGDIYLKKTVDISEGNADEILKKISDAVFYEMIPRFFSDELYLTHQEGEVVIFQRRTPKDSEIQKGLSDRQIYDYIRMLDGEGYPKAFIKYGNKKVVFSDASMSDGTLTAKISLEELIDE